MMLYCRLSIFTLLLGIVYSGCCPAIAKRLSCSESLVEFESEEIGDFKCVCEATTAAVAFLKSMGLETSQCITIKLVEHIPFQHDHVLIGAYNPNSLEVKLLTYSKAVELAKLNAPMPGIDLSEEIWCSYAAHELAHVISSQYIDPKVKAHTAGEYISAVTQFSVLPVKVREKILRNYQDIPAYQYRDEMSELYFLLDPNKFAVKCYLHFIAQDNPREFIDHLIKEGNGY